MVKEWLPLSELADAPGLPSSQRGLLERSRREGWKSRQRKGRGGGKEYHISSLPEATQRHLRAIEAQESSSNGGTLVAADQPSALAVIPPTALANREITPSHAMADWQREVRDARLCLLREADRISSEQGCRFHHAAQQLVAAIAAGELHELTDASRTANARRGSGRLASVGSLYRWKAMRDKLGADALAPPAPTARAGTDYPWLSHVLDYYRIPSKPTISAAFEKAKKDWPEGMAQPSLRTVQRVLEERVPEVFREWGRNGPHALRKFKPYTRRSTAGYWPMELVTVDGHMFKAFILGRNGARYRPEITTYLDAATRRVLAFSIEKAESAYSIWVALRSMVLNPEMGIPAMEYSDRGAYTSARHVALLERLGITQFLSQPYRAQSRGMIERLNSSLWVPLAKSLPGYSGLDVDKEHIKKTLKKFDQGGQALTSFAEFRDLCNEAVNDYNNRPHRSLEGNMTPMQAWQKALDEGWEPTLLDGDDLHDLLPSVARTVKRGWVDLPWGGYSNFSGLDEFNGRKVRVHFDPNDARKVFVCRENGALICVADFNGGVTDYMPRTARDHAEAVREKGVLRRIENRRENALAREAPDVIEGQTYDLPDMQIPVGVGGFQIPDTAVQQPVQQLIEQPAKQEQSSVHQLYQPDPDAYLDRLDTDPAKYEAWQALCKQVEDGYEPTQREREFIVRFAENGYCKTMQQMQADFDAQFARLEQEQNGWAG